jgi:hypothetical protein
MIRISSSCSAHLALVILENQRMMGLHLSKAFQIPVCKLIFFCFSENVMCVDAKGVFR